MKKVILAEIDPRNVGTSDYKDIRYISGIIPCHNAYISGLVMLVIENRVVGYVTINKNHFSDDPNVRPSWFSQELIIGRNLPALPLSAPCVALCITGQICSGKTTLADALRDLLHAKHVGIGQVVQTITDLQDKTNDRDMIQTLGHKIMMENGPAFFLNKCQEYYGIGHGDRCLIFDGIRHYGLLEEIRKLWPTLHIHLDTSNDTRYSRFINKYNNVSIRDFERINNHPVEADAEYFFNNADVIYNNDDCIFDMKHAFCGLISGVIDNGND